MSEEAPIVHGNINVHNTLSVGGYLRAQTFAAASTGTGNHRCHLDGYGRLALQYTGANAGVATVNKIHLDAIYGHIHYAGNFYQISDDRFKINERPINNAIDTVMGLNFYEYEKVDEKNGTEATFTERGVIAQDLLGTDLEFAVGGNEEEHFFLSYNNINMTMGQALKDLVGQVQSLEARIAELEGK